jgi:cyclopropane fatty-acyl-phospholipid synthase-like methyltransferase
MKRVDRRHDAFGLEIASFFEGGRPFEIVERDDGYIDAANSTGQYFAEYRQWPDRQKRGMKYVRGPHVLDVGCGAGRVSLYLQSRGFRVTAIDNSPLAVRTCTKRGVKRARVLALEDIGRLRGRRFDTVVMFGNNFGPCGNPTKAKRLLKQLHGMTSDSAMLIAETIDPYRTTNPLHRQYLQRNRQQGRMPGQIRIRIRFQRVAGAWFDYLLVSLNEMKDILNGSGWTVTRWFNDSDPAYVAVIAKI